MALVEDYRRNLVRDFHQHARFLLSERERQALYKILKDYHRRRQIDRLVQGLKSVLKTPEKLQLLSYIRNLIPQVHWNEFDKLINYQLRVRRQRSKKQKAIDRRHAIRPGEAHSSRSLASSSDLKVLTIRRKPGDQSLGFSIRGGSEHGLGVYVSEVEAETAADKAGLEVGDKILEVNSVSLKNVASSSAVKVLTGSNRLKLAVRKTKKVPEWRFSKEKTSWYDVHNGRIVAGDFEECGTMHFIRGLDVEIPERRVSLAISKKSMDIGFNIRGGNEYGLGIYVSSIDNRSLAEQNDIRVGDHIIDANGVPFENINHERAVEVLRNQPHLILTLRDVGRYPAYKELYAEYTWSDGQAKSEQGGFRKSYRMQKSLLDKWIAQDDHYSEKAESLSTDRGYQTERYSDIYSTLGPRPPIALPLQSEIFLPQSNDVIVASNTENKSGWDSPLLSDDEIYDINTGDEGNDIGSSWVMEMKEVRNTSNHTQLSDSDGSNVKLTDKSSLSRRSGLANPGYLSDSEHDLSAPGRSHQEESSGTGTDSQTGEYNLQRRKSSTRDLSFSSDGKGQFSDHTENSHPDFSLHSRTIENGLDFIKDEEIAQQKESVLKELKNTRTHKEPTLRSPEKPSVSSDKGSGKYSTSYSVRSQKRLSVEAETFKEPVRSSADAEHADKQSFGDKVNSFSQMSEQINDLEDRKVALGMVEMSTMVQGGAATKSKTLKKSTGSCESQTNVHSEVDGAGRIKWKTIKKKLKDSFRKSIPSEKSDLSGETVDGYCKAVLEDSAKKMLSSVEFEAVMRHVKVYHETKDLNVFVDRLLDILDTPEKLLLLRDIRGVVYPSDICHFDRKVNKYEVEAFETMSMKLHLPLNHEKSKKPKRNLMTAQIDKNGHFHIQSELYNSEPETDVETDGTRSPAHVESFQTNTLNSPAHMGRVKTNPLFSNSYSVNRASDTSHKVEWVPARIACRTSSEIVRDTVVAYISKNKRLLGLSVSGGVDCSSQTMIKIDDVLTGGAADDEKKIQPGMTVLSVDDQSLVGATHSEAVATLKKCFKNKRKVSMKLILEKEVLSTGNHDTKI